MALPNYLLYVPFVIKWEGGFVNDPDDNGGATNRGITWDTFQALSFKVLAMYPTWTNFLNLTKEQAGLIVKHFWDKATYNNSIISQKVAEAVTSWYWGSGALGLKNVQRLLNEKFGKNLTADGVIGPKTIQAINSINPDTLFDAMYQARKEFFENLTMKDPSQVKFLKGWINRLNDFYSRHPKK